jgi:hypothetical protein
MYAVARDNTFDPEKLAEGSGKITEFQSAHAVRPGYCGNVVVDDRSSRQIILTLWRSEEEAEASRSSLGPVTQNTLVPRMAKPSALVGVGEFVFNDFSTLDPAQHSQRIP